MTSTLLIAEGDAELRNIYRRFLVRRGYDVELAADCLDCLDKLRRARPAVFVLDLGLRCEGDGPLSWLRNEGEIDDVAVVLTGTAGYPFAADEICPPVVKFLSKPFALTELLESIRGAVAPDRTSSL